MWLHGYSDKAISYFIICPINIFILQSSWYNYGNGEKRSPYQSTTFPQLFNHKSYYRKHILHNFPMVLHMLLKIVHSGRLLTLWKTNFERTIPCCFWSHCSKPETLEGFASTAGQEIASLYFQNVDIFPNWNYGEKKKYKNMFYQSENLQIRSIKTLYFFSKFHVDLLKDF